MRRRLPEPPRWACGGPRSAGGAREFRRSTLRVGSAHEEAARGLRPRADRPRDLAQADLRRQSRPLSGQVHGAAAPRFKRPAGSRAPEAPGNLAVSSDGRVFFNFHRRRGRTRRWPSGWTERPCRFPTRRSTSSRPVLAADRRQGRLWTLDTDSTGSSTRVSSPSARDAEASSPLGHSGRRGRLRLVTSRTSRSARTKARLSRRPRHPLAQARAHRLRRREETSAGAFSSETRRRGQAVPHRREGEEDGPPRRPLRDAPGRRLDRDRHLGEWLYYGAMSGERLYRVGRRTFSTRASLPRSSRTGRGLRPEAAERRHLARHGGNVYLCDVEHGRFRS